MIDQIYFFGMVIALASAPAEAPHCLNPEVTWSISRGQGYMLPSDMTTDSFGNIWFVGAFSGTRDFDPGPAVENLTSTWNPQQNYYSLDIFVCKFNLDGSYAWTKVLRGVGDEYEAFVTSDGAGGIYVAGTFEYPIDFDPGDAVDQISPINDPSTPGPDSNSFLTHLHADGSYGGTISFGGGSGESWAYAVAHDDSGNIFVAGRFGGAAVDFDPGPGTDLRSNVGVGGDAFLVKLNANLEFVWARTFGGAGADAITAIAADHSGNVFSVGTFRGTVDFDPTSGVDVHHQTGNIEDIF
ncbi:MAG: hypothetical protein HY287_16615 [Planctomycetes bacterium]|nr:hypothetical protein [Planctomycetota bacterium]MBI3835950.1 hypothetical protein [Planctomycetota bacterium]